MINLRKLAIGGIVIIVVVLASFAASNTIMNNGENITQIITYGETTYNNQQYKSIVDGYFAQNSNVDPENVTSEVITANEVNEVAKGISNKTYDSNQIFSCAYVDLNSSNLTVSVDESRINLVTEEMYASALNSSGITQGYVSVTSPVSATGESALAGIMSCYEKATHTQIPEEVKKAANDEIYTQSEIVNNTNASADEVSDLVSEVKENVTASNDTSLADIISTIENVARENNIDLSQEDINKLAEAIFQSYSVKDQADSYKSQITEVINNGGNGFSIFNIFNF